MFRNAYAFNQPIGAWNTGAVTNMDNMFNGATVFNQNISAWNVINVSPKPPTDFSNSGSSLTPPNWFA
jgi:surface protein